MSVISLGALVAGAVLLIVIIGVVATVVLTTDSSAGAPVVIVAGTNTLLGPEDVFYMRADEDSDVLDAAEQAGFLVLRGA